MAQQEKYYVWSCPNGWLAAATDEQLGGGEEPWKFHGYSYVGSCMATSAADARQQFLESNELECTDAINRN